jgi:hypothetical protein
MGPSIANNRGMALAIIILSFVTAVLGVAVLALYRQFGLLGRQIDIESRWPFQEFTVGQAMPASLLEASEFTGLVIFCADDNDAFGAIFSVSVVASEWNCQLLVVIGQTAQSSGWTSRLDMLSGFTRMTVGVSEIRSLIPSRLPVALYLDQGHLVEASIALSSPSIIAERFQYVAPAVGDKEADDRSIAWQ